MATVSLQPGSVPIAAVTTPASINSSYQPSGDAAWPTKFAGTTANGTNVNGDVILHVFVEYDGTNGARYTVDGSTPTIGHGHLVPFGAALAAGTSAEIVVLGLTKATNFKIIGTGNGIKVTWYLEVQDDRR